MKFADAVLGLRDQKNPERCKIESEQADVTLYPSPDGSIQGCSILQEWLDVDDWVVSSPDPKLITLSEALHLLKGTSTDIVTQIDGVEYRLTPHLIIQNVETRQTRVITFRELLKSDIFRV